MYRSNGIYINFFQKKLILFRVPAANKVGRLWLLTQSLCWHDFPAGKPIVTISESPHKAIIPATPVFKQDTILEQNTLKHE
ncbi:hypothetical protein NP83_02490 [Neobacillus niacini]|nr:hypothetical protein NP83_02490 [Neobacillus niacini]